MAGRRRVARPAWWWFLLLDGGIVLLTGLSFSRPAHHRVGQLSGGRLPGRPALRTLLAATAVIHISEAAVAGRLAARKGLPRRGWVVQTFVVGFPSLLALRRQPDERVVSEIVD
jgi:hypothetical protein